MKKNKVIPFTNHFQVKFEEFQLKHADFTCETGGISILVIFRRLSIRILRLASITNAPQNSVSAAHLYPSQHQKITNAP